MEKVAARDPSGWTWDKTCVCAVSGSCHSGFVNEVVDALGCDGHPVMAPDEFCRNPLFSD